MIAGELGKNFVPEAGITRAVLQANLLVHFPRGTQIERRIQLGKDGETGWFIAGGGVTEKIIESLQHETKVKAIRDGIVAAGQVLGMRSTRNTQQSEFNDRHRAPDGSLPSPTPLPLDEKAKYSQNRSRHQKAIPESVPSGSIVPFIRPANLGDFPGHEVYTERNFQDFQEWKGYVRLEGQRSNPNRHKDIPADPVEPPPPYRPVEAAPSPSRPRPGREPVGKTDNAAAHPESLPPLSRKTDRPIRVTFETWIEPPPRRRLVTRHEVVYYDSSHSESDSDDDYIIEYLTKTRKSPWSRRETTMERQIPHPSQRRHDRRRHHHAGYVGSR